MIPVTHLHQLNTEQLLSFAAQLLGHVERLAKKVLQLKPCNQPLTHDIAQLKHHCFAKVASRSALAPQPAPSPARQPPKRTALAPEFSRTLIQMPMYLQCFFILRRFV